jgi:rare lipoprotein A (peptidoglycan hydrolase)
MKFKLLRALARCIAALAVGTALFSVSAASRQEHTTNSRVQKGRAAFYSPVLEGHKTACGGRYVASELTTAHRSLPCGTRVRITNTKCVPRNTLVLFTMWVAGNAETVPCPCGKDVWKG